MKIRTKFVLPVLISFITLLLQSCEMKEETLLKPEVVITYPASSNRIVKGAEINISARLSGFNRYLTVHRVTLKLNDSILIQKHGYIPHASYPLKTWELPGNSPQITVEVRFTDDTPKDKDWNFFSLRDYVDEYVESDNPNQGQDTLITDASVILNLTKPGGSPPPMSFASIPAATIPFAGDSVRINPYKIGKYEVTNQQYSAFMNAIGVDTAGLYGNIQYIFLTSTTGIVHNGEKYIPGNDMESIPVIHVTWQGAMHFARWMGGRLPTEAEWYYAADTTYKYSGSNSAQSVAWYQKNANGHPHPVGQKTPNTYGIYDMSGNVAEWCLGWYNNSSKIYRGGHWSSPIYHLIINRRSHLPPEAAGNYLGFRVVVPI
jgi:hypothetical protein